MLVTTKSCSQFSIFVLAVSVLFVFTAITMLTSTIVKHIIEAHKEKIYVESEFGIGSEFSFTLEKAKNKKVIRKTEYDDE